MNLIEEFIAFFLLAYVFWLPFFLIVYRLVHTKFFNPPPFVENSVENSVTKKDIDDLLEKCVAETNNKAEVKMASEVVNNSSRCWVATEHESSDIHDLFTGYIHAPNYFYSHFYKHVLMLEYEDAYAEIPIWNLNRRTRKIIRRSFRKYQKFIANHRKLLSHCIEIVKTSQNLNNFIRNILNQANSNESNKLLFGKGRDSKADVVVGLIKNDQNQLLLGERGPDTKPVEMIGLYAAPGGKTEDFDSDDLQALKREISEETGLITHDEKFYSEYVNSDNKIINHYLIEKFEGTPTVSEAERFKTDHWSWFDLADALKLPLVPGMAESIYSLLVGKNAMLTASTGYDNNYIERAKIPEGFFPVFINNKDDLCTLHAINVQLPKEQQIDIQRHSSNVPDVGYSPLDFIPSEHVSIYADGKLMIGAGKTAINLMWSKNGPDGHYDALVPIERLVDTIKNLNVYPNGKCALKNVGKAAAIIINCGKSSVEFKPRYIKIANLEEFVAHPLAVEPEVTISDRSDLFADITHDERMSKPLECAADTSKMARVLFGNTNSFSGQRYSTNAYSLTAQLDTDVRENDGTFPATVFFDFSGNATRDDVDLVEASVTGIAQSVGYKKLTEDLSMILPVVAQNDANNNKNTEKRVKHFLNTRLNTYSDTNPNNWQHIYSRLISGFLATSMGMCRNPAADNTIIGNNGFAWANVRAARRAPEEYRLNAADENTDACLLPYTLQQLERNLSDQVLDTNGNFPISYIPIPRGMHSTVPGTVTAGGNAVNDYNPFVVLANFWRTNLGFPENASYSGACFNSFINRFSWCPRFQMMLAQGRLPWFITNNANYNDIFTRDTFINPKSWMAAIIFMLRTVGGADDFFKAWTEVVARSFSFMDASVTEINCNPSTYYYLDTVAAPNNRDAIVSVTWNRLVAMRFNHPNSGVIEANNGNAAAARANNASQLNYSVIVNGPVIRAGHPNVAANANAIFNATFGAGNNANAAPLAALPAHGMGSLSDAAWYARLNMVDITDINSLVDVISAMDFNELASLHLWLTDNGFRARFGMANAAFNNYVFHVNDTLAGRNAAAYPIPNNATTRRENVQMGYYINRNKSKTVTNMCFRTQSTVPMGLQHIKTVIATGNTYNTDTYALQVANLLNGLQITHHDVNGAAGTAFHRTRRCASYAEEGEEIHNKFLLISMNMAIQMRCVADAISAMKNLSFSTLSYYENILSTGDALLDNDINLTSYGLKRGNIIDYQNEYMQSLSSSINAIGYPLNLATADGVKVTRSFFNRTDQYRYNTNDRFNPLVAAAPAGIHVNYNGVNRDLAGMNWRVLSPILFEIFTNSQAKWGGILRADFKLIRAMVPGARNPWSGYCISEAAGSPYELLGALNTNLHVIDKYMKIKLVFAYNRANNDYDPANRNDYSLFEPITAGMPKRSFSYPHSAAAINSPLYYLASPLRLLPSIIPSQVWDNMSMAFEPSGITNMPSIVYKSMVRNCELPAVTTQHGEYGTMTWNVNAYNTAANDYELLGSAGAWISPADWDVNVRVLALDFGRGWSTISTPLFTTQLANNSAQRFLNGRNRAIYAPSAYHVRNASYYNYQYGGQQAGLSRVYRTGAGTTQRLEFHYNLQTTGGGAGVAAMAGTGVAASYHFSSNTPVTNNNPLNQNGDPMNAQKYLYQIPFIQNRLRRYWSRLSFANPIFRLYGSNDAVSFDNNSYQMPTPTGRSSACASPPNGIGIQQVHISEHVGAKDEPSVIKPAIEVPSITFLHGTKGNEDQESSKPIVTPKTGLIAYLKSLSGKFGIPAVGTTNLVSKTTKKDNVEDVAGGEAENEQKLNLDKSSKETLQIVNPKTEINQPLPTDATNKLELIIAKNSEQLAQLKDQINVLSDENKKLQQTIKENNAEKDKLQKDIKELQKGKSSVKDNHEAIDEFKKALNDIAAKTLNNEPSNHENQDSSTTTSRIGWLKGTSQSYF